MNTLVSNGLWQQIKGISQHSRVKVAAVSYVTCDKYVKFGDGDTLVVDAADSTIMQGQTDARVITRAVKRGAEVYSLANLHSKVLVLDKTVVIGSANLSAFSAHSLVEAAWIMDRPSAAIAARRFIQHVARRATPVDQGFLDHISGITVRPFRRPSGRTTSRQSTSIMGLADLMFFQEILPGDLKKYETRSSASSFGGGARDLRISPANEFRPVLEAMLPFPGPLEGVSQGFVHWATPGGLLHSVPVELWPPTNARSNELRIARFYDVGGWKVDARQYLRDRELGRRWFYLLEMDDEGTVSARIVKQQDLGAEQPLVAEQIARQCDRVGTRGAVRGAVKVSAGICIP